MTRRPVRCRWARIGGITEMAAMATTTPSPAVTKNGAFQPPRCASSSPAGTPSTDAAENAPNSAPMALPRRSGGTESVRIDSDSAVAGPPKAPAITRASNIVPRLVARPPAAVPATSPIIATNSARRRSKRSRNCAETRPATAAEAV